MEFVIKKSDKDSKEGDLEDGHLEIEVNYAEPFVHFTDWQKGKEENQVSEFDGDEVLTKLKTQLTSNLNGLKTYVKTSVEDSLKRSQFVLEGSGYFTMHNPVFTNKGDLLVEIRYKGIPPNGDPTAAEFKQQQLSPNPAARTSMRTFVNVAGPTVSAGVCVKG